MVGGQNGNRWYKTSGGEMECRGMQKKRKKIGDQGKRERRALRIHDEGGLEDNSSQAEGEEIEG